MTNLEQLLNKGHLETSESTEARRNGVAGLTEEELIARAQQGDQQAFRMLVEATQERAYSVALGYCKDPEDAMDRVQDAYVKAFRSLSRFQGGSAFYTWFYRILMNGCIDFSRRESKRKKDVEYDEGIGTGEESVNGTTGRIENANPAKTLANQELAQKIEAAMDKLSDSHREILLMREVQGLSYEELSEVLGLARGTVMSRLHHARLNLKGYLEGYVNEG